MFPPQVFIFIWVCTNIFGGRDVKEECGLKVKEKELLWQQLDGKYFGALAFMTDIKIIDALMFWVRILLHHEACLCPGCTI